MERQQLATALIGAGIFLLGFGTGVVTGSRIQRRMNKQKDD